MEKGLSTERIQQHVEPEFTHLQMDGIYFGLKNPKKIQMITISDRNTDRPNAISIPNDYK